MMNIRSLSNPQAATPLDANQQIRQAQRAVKTEDTEERDADGRQPYGEQKRPVTDEELQKIIESIRKHEGVKANNLTVELTESGDIKVLLIKTPEGQIVRRVPEGHFYELLSFIGQSNARLLNKSA